MGYGYQHWAAGGSIGEESEKQASADPSDAVVRCHNTF